MVEIKEQYLKTYQAQLSDDIKKYCDEDLRSILLALVKGVWERENSNPKQINCSWFNCGDFSLT